MSRIAYVNGRYVPFARANVHVEDRGYQFADGVYEVCAVRGGQPIDEAPHLARLERSLGELRIRMPIPRAALSHVLREMIARNGVADGIAYIQVTRGVARRDHPFPTKDIRPSLVVTLRGVSFDKYDAAAAKGVAVVTRRDERWARCDIKSTALLANILAKQSAREAGAFEAWLFDENNVVREGASTNAWIVDEHGVLRTMALNNRILPGVTRGELLAMCRQLGVTFEERAFSVEEAKRAREAFVTAASAGVLPVVSIDGQRIGEGAPGPVAQKLRNAYWLDRV